MLLVEPYQGRRAIDKILEILGTKGTMIVTGSGDAELEAIMTQTMAKHDNLIFG